MFTPQNNHIKSMIIKVRCQEFFSIPKAKDRNKFFITPSLSACMIVPFPHYQ